MSSLDLIRLGLNSLWRRKLRTSLTVLGVVIGTSAILIMVSLGLAMNESFIEEISRMGSLNIINVRPNRDHFYMPGGPVVIRESTLMDRGSGEEVIIDDDILHRISMIKGVEAVTPILETHLKLVSGRYQAYVSIKGIRPEVMEAMDFKAEQGRLLEEGDTLNLVFGQYVLHNFFDPRDRSRHHFHWGDPNQEPKVDVFNDRLVMTTDMSYGEIRMPGSGDGDSRPPKLYRITGVGVLQGGDWEVDNYAFMDINQLQRIIDENKRNERLPGGGVRQPTYQEPQGYQRAMVKVTDFQNVPEIQEQIKAMGLQAHSLGDVLESMKNTFATIQAVLGGIGAVSLLVAALGITNTMIMSIYERTKEIGVMKVIGASLSDIGRLFLLEATLIGFLGGLIGVGFSKGISYLLNSSGLQLFNVYRPGSMSRISIIPLWLILFTLGFTMLVGLIAGFFPARRAMKLSVLEAIRTE